MMKEGALDGVDEVYGLHNIPNFEEGTIRVKEGTVMAAFYAVKIIIKGRGGHGSLPSASNDVISAGAAILTNFHTIQSRSIESKEDIVFSIT
jgi:metal-dependent amidase/aminoacylase/carboxypeptidase family protein